MIFGYVQAVANADPSSARRRVHADIQQAEYFLELLGDEYAELSERLTHHRTELVTYEHVGDLPGIRRKERVIRQLEKDLFDVEQMVRALWKTVAPNEEPPSF